MNSEITKGDRWIEVLLKGQMVWRIADGAGDSKVTEGTGGLRNY